MNINPDDILDFWFSDRIEKHWFSSTQAIDKEMRDSYEAVWEDAADGQLDVWGESAAGSLALVIILDQLPLNMFRKQAKSFSTEQQAVSIAQHAINTGQNKQIDKDRVAFLYMPLMHSENMKDQDLAIKMFSDDGLTGFLKFASHHRDIVKKYGRFPHRNTILARESTEAELAYLASDEAFTG